MKNSKRIWLRSILICVVLVFVSSGCAGLKKGYIHVKRVEGLISKVSARHDAYVAADAKLSKLQKGIYLDSTKILRKVLVEAKK